MRKKNKKIKMPNSYFIEKDIKNYNFEPRTVKNNTGDAKALSVDLVEKEDSSKKG